MSDDALHRFATRVVELKERQQLQAQTGLDESTMRAVATELGMSEEELVKLREDSRTALKKAQALRGGGNVEEAIDVLETGLAFNPLDVEMKYLLADSLLSLSRKTTEIARAQPLWQRAKALAIEVVDIAPAHADAPVLLRAINNNEPQRRDTGFPVGVVVGIALVLAFLIGLVVLVLR